MKSVEWKDLALRGVRELRARSMRNARTKLFALAFAFAVWLWVNAGEREVQVVYFPLELTGQPQETALVGERVDRVAVHLNGPRTLLAPIEANRRPIALDLSRVKPGEPARIKIREWMVRVPRGVRVMQIEPSKIPVELEQVRHVALPVKVRIGGDVPEGYRIDDSAITVRPAKVLVSGPISALKRIKRVETEPVDVTGLNSPFEGKVALLAEHLTEVKPPFVSVEIAIVPLLDTRVFEQVAVSATGLSRDSYTLDPGRVDVTVKGPVETLTNLELEPESVFVAASSPGKGPRKARVRVKLPPGVELVRIRPERVTIRPAPGGERERESPPRPAGAEDRGRGKTR